jgi:uncharacterized protein (TIGR03083 family)
MRAAAGEVGAAGTPDGAPPPGLRDRVLAAAFAARPPGEPLGRSPAAVAAGLPSPVEVDRTEEQRAVRFLRSLGPDDWAATIDPPEFAGWTVHDVTAHLAANATLLADVLAVPVPGVPETEHGNEARTEAARARHRTLPPSAAIDEIEAAAHAVDEAVSGYDGRGTDHPGLAEEIDWWGIPTPIGWVLMVRAFETWTHTDDIRRALGRPMEPPPPHSLRAMTRAGCGLIPHMLASRGTDRPGKVVRVRFTDLPDTAWEVALDTVGVARPAGDGPVDAELTVDAVGLCRAVGRRMPEGGLTYTSVGNQALARTVVDALPALAVL